MANEAIKASALLAKKDGAYPKFDKDSILASPFLIYNTTEETDTILQVIEKENGNFDSE